MNRGQYGTGGGIYWYQNYSPPGDGKMTLLVQQTGGIQIALGEGNHTASSCLRRKLVALPSVDE